MLVDVVRVELEVKLNARRNLAEKDFGFVSIAGFGVGGTTLISGASMEDDFPRGDGLNGICCSV